MTTINLAELRQISEILFSHIEEAYGQTVALPVDYYWDIPDAELYAMDAEPTQLSVGQLSEDWEFLSKMLANILRAIGNTHIT